MWSQRESSSYVRSDGVEVICLWNRELPNINCVFSPSKASHGDGMGSISTWHVTLRYPCAGAQGLLTSTPGTIQNSTRPSTSASPPMSTALRTPTRSDSSCTVSTLQRLWEQLTTTDTKYTMAQVSRVAHTFSCDQPGKTPVYIR